jgi:hypothetical protein
VIPRPECDPSLSEVDRLRAEVAAYKRQADADMIALARAVAGGS